MTVAATLLLRICDGGEILADIVYGNERPEATYVWEEINGPSVAESTEKS